MKLYKQVSYLAASSSLLVVLASSPVFARQDSPSTSSTNSTTTTATATPTTGSNSGSASTSRMEDRTTSIINAPGQPTKAETENTMQLHDQAEAKTRGAQMIAELKAAGHTEHSQKIREQACTEHKSDIGKRVGGIGIGATRIQTKLDTALSAAKTFQDSKNLSSVSLTQLYTTAQAASQTSQQSITAAKALTPSFDCTTGTAATEVAAFKAAAETAKQNLRAYHQAVKAYVAALRTATVPTNTTTGGTN